MIPISLKETINDRKLIRQALTEFNKRLDLHNTVNEWKWKPTVENTWSAFKVHFTRAIITCKKRDGTFRDMGISKHVQAGLDENK